MIKVTVYGRLRKFLGQSSFEVSAKSPKEVFSFLMVNFEGIQEHMKTQEYCVMAGNIRITEDLIDIQTSSNIKIIPVVHGEIIKFIVGGALALTGVGSLSFLGGLTIGSAAVAAINAVGVSMLLQGVSELLAPEPVMPNFNREQDPQDQSFIMTGLVNNTKQGVPINLVYGEMLVGSTTVSSGIDTFFELI
tara:strand:+ start:266 stop:838 length:573 start_codon:yes stop_codon:yes gene_type:complete